MTAARISTRGNQLHAACAFNTALRDAGVPLLSEGYEWPHRVSRGCLRFTADEMFEESSIEWLNVAPPGVALKSVRLPLAKLQGCVDSALYATQKLRDAGIDTIGAMWPRGAKRGALVLYFDEMFEEFVYEWRV
jgi:hypothetical protein